jgi:CRISPR type III-B/RAMP module-associated protein Cmr5
MAGQAARLLRPPVSQELRTRYRQLPVMLRTAGLAATYAFVAAKANDKGDLAAAYREVARGIRTQLAARGLLPGDGTAVSDQQMLAKLAEMDLHDYARASAEVAALTRWLGRLADAVYERRDTGEG